MPPPDAAVAGLMGLREALPLVGALGAGSPFWFGFASGLASARPAIIRASPGRGLPPRLRGWEDYLESLDAIAAGGGPQDHTMVWWDARLQPRLGGGGLGGGAGPAGGGGGGGGAAPAGGRGASRAVA